MPLYIPKEQIGQAVAVGVKQVNRRACMGWPEHRRQRQWDLAIAVQAEDDLGAELIFDKASPAAGNLDIIQRIGMPITFPGEILEIIYFADFKIIESKNIQVSVPIQVGNARPVYTQHIDGCSKSEIPQSRYGGRTQCEARNLAHPVVAVQGDAPVGGTKKIFIPIPVKIRELHPRIEARKKRNISWCRYPGPGGRTDAFIDH